MPIRLPANPFVGINPLLNSLLQGDHASESARSPSIWPSFHAQHITNIAESLNKYLLPLGYLALAEQGLQIQPGDPIDYPDGTVYDRAPDSHSGPGSALQPLSQPALTRIPLAEILAMARPVRAVGIHPQPQGHMLLGQPITRIELLSPSNKRSGTHYAAYLANRAEALESGSALIEIDYLHETPAPFPDKALPRYPTDADAHPYYVAITNTRLPEVVTIIHPFGIEESIPMLDVPLAGTQVLAFDLDAVYQHTFQLGPWSVLVDYEQMPERLTSYSLTDQQRITDRLSRIRAMNQEKTER